MDTDYYEDGDGWYVHKGRLVAQTIVLVDLDSTLADTRQRSHLTPREVPGTSWDDYSMHCANDAPILGAIQLVRLLASKHEIRIVTGRSERSLELTVNWLSAQRVPWDYLRLRKQTDPEDNVEYKRAVLDELPQRSRVVLGIDDWPPVVQMWQENGIHALCVNPMYSADPNAYFAVVGTQQALESDSTS